MIDTGKIATVWNAKDVMRLDAEGWRVLQKSIVPSSDGVNLLCWHMYPPEPTLVETWRAMANRWDEPLYARTVAALERAERIEQAAQKVTSRMLLVSPPGKAAYYSIAVENVQALRKALRKEEQS